MGGRDSDCDTHLPHRHDPRRRPHRLNQFRQGIPALRKGTMSQINEWGGGMSFVRDYNDGEMDRVNLETKRAVAWLRAQQGITKVVLWGHSGGGFLTGAAMTLPPCSSAAAT